MFLELALQRLFSTFADGWPGLGLVVQRVATSTALIYCAIVHSSSLSGSSLMLPHFIVAGAGVLLLLGLWTPIAGSVITAGELWIALSSSNPTTALVLAAFGASLAMIGPGAWSIDALLFGRKHL